jgi:sterol desaturase/sphingolipid hydroxylase (fatty acid hydroxylase superfamily)
MVARWVLGLVFSLLIGHFVTEFFLGRLRRRIERIRLSRGLPPWYNAQLVPPWLTGLVERLFFTIAVALNVPGVVVAMIAWIGVKMATDWNRPGGERQDAGGAFSALLAGLVSMLFSLLGGAICRTTMSGLQ